jgi:predicted NBD/HSP70 family sugar kinase
VSANVTVCVEIGASSMQTVLLSDGVPVSVTAGAQQPPAGAPLLVAVPGLVEGRRVLAASNLGWYDVDPAEALGLPFPADLVCNDAEAAALGESALRPGTPDLVFVGLGTGVGGAVVRQGSVEANLFAHLPGFGSAPCRCTQLGCLETVAGGWALPAALTAPDLEQLAAALAAGVRREPLATPALVVLAGGIAAAYPQLLDLLAERLPEKAVEGSAAPGTKSAAAWGLLHLWQQSLRTTTARA